LFIQKSLQSVIFEDDFILTPKFHEQVIDIIDTLEDFDVVILGNFDGNHGQHVVKTIYRLDPNRLCTGTHAYLVKNENVPHITDNLSFKTNFDLELPDIIHEHNLNGFVLWPRIAFHNNSFPSATS
jgi:GR25 family glycosyltransferase involved in LPS biosynthesis